MFKNILLASDGSDYALKAASQAAELAKKFDAGLTIIAVFDKASHPPLSRTAQPDLTPSQTQITALQDAVLTRTGRMVDETGTAYKTRTAIGHPVEEIVRAAEDEHADLIVLGSRGLGGVRSFLLGSVSDRVAHRAHCPVLIVR